MMASHNLRAHKLQANFMLQWLKQLQVENGDFNAADNLYSVRLITFCKVHTLHSIFLMLGRSYLLM